MKRSSIKGDGLERHVATPAWRPLLSLESVDGDLYERMVRAFHELVAELPEPRKVAEIAEARAEEMLRTARARSEKDVMQTTTTTEAIVTLSTVTKEAAASKESGSCITKLHDGKEKAERICFGARAIDAHAVARFSLAVFVEYVFGRKWESAFEVLVDASWEWRREIAVRGRADISVKRDAVRLVVGDLIRNDKRLWAMRRGVVGTSKLLADHAAVSDIAGDQRGRRRGGAETAPRLAAGRRHARRASVPHLRAVRGGGCLRRPASRRGATSGGMRTRSSRAAWR